MFTLQTLPAWDDSFGDEVGKVAGLLRASCPPPFGPAYGCSKSRQAILSSRWILLPGWPCWCLSPESASRALLVSSLILARYAGQLKLSKFIPDEVVMACLPRIVSTVRAWRQRSGAGEANASHRAIRTNPRSPNVARR